jgi:hypothetical protein
MTSYLLSLILPYFTIDGQRTACGYLMFVGFANDDRTQAAEFFVQQTGGPIGRLGTEGVATDEFGEVFGMGAF